MEGDAEANGDANGEILGPCLTGYVDDGSPESHRYYLSRRTVLEMIRDRGYSVPSSEIDLSLQDFRALHGQNPDVERLRFSATHRTDPSDRITDLLVNITKHVLKPKHHVLTEQEKQKLLKKYNIEENQLPRLSRKDAIAQYYGLEKGQVVKVTYTGDITESHVTYRCIW
ncbi:hypothetical protein PRUPE_7G043600 [Prunus persica]|uniref:RNA polymerase subunit H/Rpb5 C-terminal domain-containing protein n=1 Tax=Prunus persica TaxID=3760 RepID=A0A251N8R2_PRUPE|nr:hypothetical protein PRUPE_7G043600 [Prunus persica]